MAISTEKSLAPPGNCPLMAEKKLSTDTHYWLPLSFCASAITAGMIPDR
jgi:hypothetical protein